MAGKARTGSGARADWRLGQLIKRADQLLASQKAEVLRQYELTVPQYSTLLALSSATDMTGAQLARASAVTPQTMAGILGNLEEKGLIGRTPSDLHPKVLVTTLTRSGKALVRKADAEVQAVEDRLASAFDEREGIELRALLERAVGALSGPR